MMPMSDIAPHEEMPEVVAEPMEIWFELSSTYSYLAAARVEALASARGVRVAWKPFLLGPIFAARGLSTSPFEVDEAKGRYMWRDVERMADALGVRFRRPSVFPRRSTLAARVASMGADQDWIGAFVRGMFEAYFADNRDIEDPLVVDAVLGALGLHGPALRQRALSAEWKPRLRRQTERAASLGIFGAPTFIARGELFWGNDRLEQALDWMVR